MSDIVINSEKLCKKYVIGHQVENVRYIALRDVLMRKLRCVWHKAKDLMHGDHVLQGDAFEEIWALRDIDFDVRRGESVGVIGRNGSGKSTLLKILSRITEPTEGRVRIRGRVLSLLEVGAGFHPELTGRENIFLNGAILGMSRAEIRRKFDEIVTFAEIEKFLDTPVKRYSSGMYVRLAFSVAAHLEPEILLVDEVLSVGDATFQSKCIAKMEGVARAGRTVLFVSHNMVAVRNLCSRALWLDRGRVLQFGDVQHVVAGYLAQSTSAHLEHHWPNRDSAPGNDSFRLHRARVSGATHGGLSQITVQTPVAIEFEYWNLVPGQRLNLSLVLWNEEGTLVFNTFPVDEPTWHGRPFPVGLFRSRCEIPPNLLNSGNHRVQLYAVRDQNSVLFVCDDALSFQVVDAREESSMWYGRWVGAIRPRLKWSTALLMPEMTKSPHQERVSVSSK